MMDPMYDFETSYPSSPEWNVRGDLAARAQVARLSYRPPLLAGPLLSWLAARALPGIPVCASTDILAEFREYERASTVVLNAYLLPVMERYLASLTELLTDPVEGLGLAPAVPVMVMVPLTIT